MRKILLTACILLIIPNIVWSQDKMLRLEESVAGLDSKLRPENLKNLSWRGSTDYYVYQVNDKIYQKQARGIDSTLLLDAEMLTDIFKDAGLSGFRSVPAVTWISYNEIMIRNLQHILFIDIEKMKINRMIELESEATDITLSPDFKFVAYTKGTNLYYLDPGKAPVRVNVDTTQGVWNGSGYVHRQEFGINHGIFWSPNGNFLAYYRKDESMVKDYPLVDITKRMAELHPVKYPMAGMTSEEVELVVYDIKNRSSVTLKTGEPKDQYLTSITWGPDEKFIYTGLLNRDQNHLKLCRFEIKKGELADLLFEEKHPKYVEPEHPLVFLKNDDSKFVWWSERDGYNHLYLYSAEGKLVKQLTQGPWEVTDFLGFDKEEKYLFYISNEGSPIERQVYKTNLKSGQKIKLSDPPGTHNAILHPEGKYFIDGYSSMSVPLEYDIIDAGGEKVQTIYSAGNPLEEYRIGEVELFSIKASDGVTDLYCRMIRPPGFDPGGKYPVIIYVYGGPHSQLVQNRWMGGARSWQHFMAQKGYIAFTMDNRGTSNRGLDFESITHCQLGTIEVEDQLMGVEYLKSLPYVDAGRIGVHGWSFGGFLTLSLLNRSPDDFKAGVAGGPVIDWKYYEVMYGERYMDTPQSNPEGYEQSSLLNWVGKYRGKQLIIHGAQDPVVVWQNSLVYLQRAIVEGVQVDYFVYPTHEHNVRGKDRIHLMQKVTDYFVENL